MIEYLIALFLLRAIREGDAQPKERDYLDSCLDIGAGLDYRPPERPRPVLRRVK